MAEPPVAPSKFLQKFGVAGDRFDIRHDCENAPYTLYFLVCLSEDYKPPSNMIL
jgi:hypothetical protein